MTREESFKLLEKGILKKGTKVRMKGLRGFEEFTEIEGAFVRKARPDELEEDWVVVAINGRLYDTAWIDEISGTENIA